MHDDHQDVDDHQNVDDHEMLMIMLTMTKKMVVMIKFMHDDFAMFNVEEEIPILLVYS